MTFRRDALLWKSLGTTDVAGLSWYKFTALNQILPLQALKHISEYYSIQYLQTSVDFQGRYFDVAWPSTGYSLDFTIVKVGLYHKIEAF